MPHAKAARSTPRTHLEIVRLQRRLEHGLAACGGGRGAAPRLSRRQAHLTGRRGSAMGRPSTFHGRRGTPRRLYRLPASDRAAGHGLSRRGLSRGWSYHRSRGASGGGGGGGCRGGGRVGGRVDGGGGGGGGGGLVCWGSRGGGGGSSHAPRRRSGRHTRAGSGRSGRRGARARCGGRLQVMYLCGAG